MKFEHLAILLTCHSLEDFPVHHEGDDADSLLANWTALWHPTLIAEAKSIPTWIRTFEVPENCENHLFLCPTTSDSELQTGFAQRVKEEGGRLIRRKLRREEILEPLLEEKKQPKESIRDSFFSLGYCFLQIQLLTRQLRYSSNLDEVFFSTLVVDGATAAMEGDEETAEQKLQAAFDLLLEERDNYYPVNALLIDLTLLADTTLGEPLAKEIHAETIHTNYLMPGEIARTFAGSQPEAATALKERVESGRSTIVSGGEKESRFPLLSLESVLEELRQGQATIREHFGREVDFFGRRRYGLATSLPQMLEHFGYRGAFHFTLDDGRFPEGMQIKSFWEGDGEAKIEVFGKIPLDANAPGNFLNLGVKIGESFDMDHAAAICFVHWPGKTSIWYEDLKRICRYGSVLGKFVSTTDFLTEMEEPYQHDRFTCDQYQSPYLKQSVIRNQANPVSKSMDYWRRTLTLDSIESLNFLTSLFEKQPPSKIPVSRKAIIDDFESGGLQDNELDSALEHGEIESARRLVEALGGEDDGKPRTVIWNTDSLVQRSALQLASDRVPTPEKPVYAVSALDDGAHVVADVPSMGYVSFAAGSQPSAGRVQAIVEESALRNEFLEVVLDQTTGGVRAVHDYKTRGNRISQVLAYRAKRGDSEGRFLYSSMKMDSMETLENSSSLGRIRTRGELIFDEQPVAKFTQEFELAKGSRVLQVDVEFSDIEPPKSDPWNCYFGTRFAFGDESSLISTTLNQSRQPASNNRMEAPHYIDLENLKSRTSILTGGVPFHVRRGDRYIDSIQIVKGETCRRFRFGIGVDLANPLFHAHRLIKPLPVVETSRQLTPGFCWLFHLDTKNVLATHWEPVFADGQPSGFRVRLLETMGRETKFQLSSFKDIQSANRIRFDGQVVSELPVEKGKIALHLSSNQMVEIEARW